MRTLRDPQNLLAEGIAEIRTQFQVPAGFPPDVENAAALAAQRGPTAHADWTDRPFVTLDPAGASDLDQAFALERAGPQPDADILLHYAIADVAWFVADDDPVDREAWKRGVTTYLPDGKASLYPPMLSEKAASLLPDGPRASVVLTVRVAADGEARLEAAGRAVIRSRAKLAYATVRDEDLPPGFADLAARIAAAEDRRGAARVDPPEQEVERDAAGRLVLDFRPYSQAEARNAALSLAANLAVADAMLAAETGLFRVMAPPDAIAIERLRRTAEAFRIDWPGAMSLDLFERRLDPAQPREAALMLAIRRAGQGASYAPHEPGETPWHAPMAASYAHATAPLRRLADRYVLRAVLSLTKGEPVEEAVETAFQRLPQVMRKAESRAAQVERAVIDLAETVLLAGQEGAVFPAIVTDVGETGARIQLRDLPVVARTSAPGALPGADLAVRLRSADPVRRTLEFDPVA